MVYEEKTIQSSSNAANRVASGSDIKRRDAGIASRSTPQTEYGNAATQKEHKETELARSLSCLSMRNGSVPDPLISPRLEPDFIFAAVSAELV